MKHLQRYLFLEVLTPLLIAVAALAALALLTQTLNYLSLIVDEQETFLLFIRILALTLPLLMGLVLPVALFIAVTQALHRMHTDSELAVASASGLSRWGVLSPILRLTAFVMIVQLALGLWAQPYAYREMRRTLHEARIELASNLFQPGQFTFPADDLTIFVGRQGEDGVMEELMIWDRRSSADTPVTYIAARGRLFESATTPAVWLYDASAQWREEDGRLNFVEYDSYAFQLSQFIEPPGQLLYKLSDRFASELLFPDLTHYWERDNAGAMAAEGHSRLAAPFYDLALALMAALAVLGGDYRRKSYSGRIAIAALAALALRVAGFAVQAAAAEAAALNPAQYLLPASAAAITLALYFRRKRGRRLRPQPRMAWTPAPA